MIGFLPQKTKRRPIYSITGQKLCYLTSGPEGEWIYSLSGRKYAKLTARHKEWIAKLAATQYLAGIVLACPEEVYED